VPQAARALQVHRALAAAHLKDREQREAQDRVERHRLADGGPLVVVDCGVVEQRGGVVLVVVIPEDERRGTLEALEGSRWSGQANAGLAKKMMLRLSHHYYKRPMNKAFSLHSPMPLLAAYNKVHKAACCL
jgi:hypothetical protein